jgi:hypothetical protein
MRRTTILLIAFASAVIGGAWWTHVRAAEDHSGAAAHNPPVPSPTSSRKIDEYGNIPFSDEKARLDNFAIEVRADPTVVGYIICYGGRRGYAGEAQRRCKRAAGYLTKTRGIAATRIKTIDGGYREGLTVELWAPSAFATPPMASPTVDPSEVTIIKRKHKVKRRT